MVCMKWVARFLVIPLSKIAKLVDLDFSVSCGLARWRMRWRSSEMRDSRALMVDMDLLSQIVEPKLIGLKFTANVGE
ncbi:hypothetical protein HanLR1_Chr02g0046851 [Helianthus annuus]|nr:hypothetical protein HanLR1_Chr02g0046851 [Helianthus annuus]